MTWALHGIMIGGASLNLCCVLGSRRSRSGLAVVSTLVMLAAMTDSAFGVFGLGPLPWAAILIAWGLTCSALLRRRTATGAPQNATPHGGAGQTMLLHHPLGLVVTAGQLMAHTVMSPGGAAAAGHTHSDSLLLPLVCVAGGAFVVWSLVLLVTESRTRLERGNLLGMSAMTAAMAVMPFA
ncbi:hypothetical protein E3O55_16190 [Cryobacterium sp. MDB1-18-2]|uniref:hypothetical protein n=1 Tax=unclassified Cryobacterium TaxID=2649013 RepID=UPI00106BB5DA|nr:MULTISPECIES: hypothetical protein [unclassified Cryobacterium]TFC24156.1 hypothetical protein E3O55_16190 [Cryobacterium sp. MDB1-18-2]TFC42384.1 hypothetical protein E3O50_09080 [Cryobacterium sp. MDB1-18-1]